MSGYLRKIKVPIDFEDDKVVVWLRPIGHVEYLEIVDLMPDAEKLKDPKYMDTAEFMEKGAKLAARSKEIMAAYVESLEGLRDLAGESVTKEEMFRDAYFGSLVARVFQQWFKKAVPKNPQAPTSTSIDGSAVSHSPPETPITTTVG